MGLFTKKDPCAICGGKVTGLFVSKVEGQLVCKECYGNVDIPSERSPLTMEQFKQYRQFRAENQKLREQFHTTQHVNFGFFGADFVFDRNSRLFCLDPGLNRTIFHGSEIRSFVIREDDAPLFEGSAQGFRRYESDVPERIRALTPLIDEYRMRVEMQRSMERMAEERRRRDPDAPPPPPPPAPTIDLPEPFGRFYVEITLEHPYWTIIQADKKGPTFSGTDPDTADYMREYSKIVDEMECLATALKEVAFPNAPEVLVGAAQDAGNYEAPAAAPTDAVTEIRRYKELLDQGLITEEEFSAKKRQLLGI